jgi:hypothetical protein
MYECYRGPFVEQHRWWCEVCDVSTITETEQLAVEAATAHTKAAGHGTAYYRQTGRAILPVRARRPSSAGSGRRQAGDD